MAKVFEVNTSNGRGSIEVLREVIWKNFWKEVNGTRGKLLWLGLAPTTEDIECSKGKIVNRIPGLEEVAHKRPMGELLKFVYKYFPEVFNIFPKTYLLPEDFEQLENLTKKKKSYFIVKPTSGSQGEGIFIINSSRDLESSIIRNWSDLVVQEYLHPPLLLRNKKFDLRIYALITNLDPLCVFINEEGLARFCTEDYQAPNNSNISNAFMHLTNYSLNKRSAKFVHTDEISEINDGSKQTLRSFYRELEINGCPVDVIKNNINDLVLKTMIAIQPALMLQLKSKMKLAKLDKLKYFHIIGIDVMLTDDFKAWLLEINANPSLRIDFEQEVSPGVSQNLPSDLDKYVKMMVVEDAIKIARLKKSDQLVLPQYESYSRLLPGNHNCGECSDILLGIFNSFCTLTDIKDPSIIPLGKFRKIFSKVKGRLNKEIVSADFDILYIKVLKKLELSQMNYIGFVTAIEEIATKFLNGSDKDKLTYLLTLLA